MCESEKRQRQLPTDAIHVLYMVVGRLSHKYLSDGRWYLCIMNKRGMEVNIPLMNVDVLCKIASLIKVQIVWTGPAANEWPQRRGVGRQIRLMWMWLCVKRRIRTHRRGHFLINADFDYCGIGAFEMTFASGIVLGRRKLNLTGEMNLAFHMAINVVQLHWFMLLISDMYTFQIQTLWVLDINRMVFNIHIGKVNVWNILH